MPREVLADARRYLSALEAQAVRSQATPQGSLALETGGADAEAPDPDLESAGDHPRDAVAEAVVAAVETMDPDALTPKEALEKIYQLKKLLSN
jgi:DNA mismatch repair protein MutS